MQTAENEPLFKTVGQALYFSFALDASPPSTPSPTDEVTKIMRERRYGEAPIPDSEKSMNFAGLKPVELRAQCALLVEAVNTTLVAQERDAIWARFGHQTRWGATEGGGSQYGRVVGFRPHGVRNLRDHYASLCNSRSDEAVFALIWAIYVPGIRQWPGESPRSFTERLKKRKNEWSTRSIEASYGIGRSVLRRDQDMLRKLLYGVEMLAQAKLEELFIKSKVIGDPNDA